MAHLLDLTKPLHFVVDNVLSIEECQSLINVIEERGPRLAPITTARGPLIDADIRNNTRVMFDDEALAERLFQRIKRHCPPEIKGLEIVGANERLRCYKYEVGQRFAPHYDGAFFRSDNERSFLTYLIYLNDNFEGGQTDLLSLGKKIAPKPGRALLFQHAILHEGCAVTRGIKYAVRSDVMYRTRAGVV
ncbi:MAG: 2OG-Fe(II) oxygenase [Polyangiaceae bacterium]|nr:2OG-Fe(II) oxygenase [Polyangiaceae bacterium]